MSLTPIYNRARLQESDRRTHFENEILEHMNDQEWHEILTDENGWWSWRYGEEMYDPSVSIGHTMTMINFCVRYIEGER